MLAIDRDLLIDDRFARFPRAVRAENQEAWSSKRLPTLSTLGVSTIADSTTVGPNLFILQQVDVTL